MNTAALNIWIINHYAGNLKYGMEYRHFFLARHLHRAGHRPIIISSSFHHLFTNLPQISGRLTFEIFEGIPFSFIKVPSYRGNGFRRLLNIISFSLKLNRYYKVIEKRFHRPDVALCSTPHPFVYFNLAKLRKIYNIPVIYEVRDLWPQMLIELGFISHLNPISHLFYWIERRAYKESDRVISLWHSADKYMLKHGLEHDRYAYLPNGTDVFYEEEFLEGDQSHPLLQMVQQRHKAGKFVIGYAGSHGFANPLECIAKACVILKKRNIHDVEFLLVGDGPLKENIISTAKNLNLDNLHFYKYVDKSVIMAFYRILDVAFIGLKDLPLFRYGPTPNKLMDYLAAGKPIIYAINSSFDPVKEAGAGVSISADDAEQLVEAILTLKSKPAEELEAMGVAGRKYVESELSYRVLADRLSELFVECIAEKMCSH